MTIFSAIILGIVEGITEFLPISSTGHLILATRLLGIVPTEFVKSFEIAIQVGAMGAVGVALFDEVRKQPRVLWPTALAFLPTALIGLALYGFVKQFLLGNVEVVVVSMIVGGFLLILFERFTLAQPVTKIHALPWWRAVLIGVCQSVAIIPGISRAGATIIGGMMLGFDRRAAVLFSFLLAIPTLFAATALDLWESSSVFSAYEWSILLVGALAAFVSAYITARWLLRYVATHSFALFGWYRVALGSLFLILLGLGIV